MLSNGKIKKINSLKSKKTRQISQLFTIEGIKSVKEIAVCRTIVLREVFALEPFVGELASLCPCPVVPVGRDEMARISAQTTPEGVLAVCEIPPEETPDFSPGRIAKRCRYLKTSAQDIHRSILIINMMHMRRTI